MAVVAFWEKPGCGGNARQKARLGASGHMVITHDLLTEPWTAARLRGFFGDLPVTEWFNRAAPRIKVGEIVPETMSEEAALAAMIAEPLLIRRPLMEAQGRRVVGFDEALIDAWIGLAPAATPVGEGCARPEEAAHAPCPPPRR